MAMPVIAESLFFGVVNAREEQQRKAIFAGYFFQRGSRVSI